MLMDAEAAANSAAIQLVSFKDAMDDEYAVGLQQFWIKLALCKAKGFPTLNICFWNCCPAFSLIFFFLMSIKDSRQSAKDKRRITRQRGLLLEKLEDFRRINKSVRQKLKQLQEAEVC